MKNNPLVLAIQQSKYIIQIEAKKVYIVDKKTKRKLPLTHRQFFKLPL